MTHLLTLSPLPVGPWIRALLHASWQAAVVVLLLLLLERLLRRRSARLRLLLLLVALVKFAVPPFLTVPTGLFHWVPVATAPALDPAGWPLLGGRTDRSGEAMLTEHGPDRFSSGSSPDPLGVSTAAASAGLGEESGSRAATRFAYGLVLIHLLGSLLTAAVLLRSRWRLERQVRCGRVAPASWRARLERLAARDGSDRIPRLLLSHSVSGPLCFGIRRPTILLPAGLAGSLQGRRLDIVLAHELAHLRHRDPWVHLLSALLALVWWFHPAFWLLVGRLRQVQEDRSDDASVGPGAERGEAYCRTLLQVARDVRQVPRNPALSPLTWDARMAGEEKALARRFRRILDPEIPRPDPSSHSGGSAMSARLLVIALALILLPGVRLIAADPGPGPSRPSRSPEAVRQDDLDAQRQAVERGLAWLAGRQAEDGGWKVEAGGTADSPSETDRFVTGLTLLSFLGAGQTVQHGPHREVVGKGLAHVAADLSRLIGADWTADGFADPSPDGALEDAARRFGLGVCGLALIEGYGLSGQERWKQPAQDVVLAIERMQAKEGCWHADGSPSAGLTYWMTLSLLSARDFQLEVDAQRVLAAVRWLGSMAERRDGNSARSDWPPCSPTAATAASLLPRMMAGQESDELRPVAESLRQAAIQADDERFFTSYAVWQFGGDLWEQWRAEHHRPVLARQQLDGPRAGSWDPDSSPFGQRGGRLYATAVNVLTLEVFYRYAKIVKSG